MNHDNPPSIRTALSRKALLVIFGVFLGFLLLEVGLRLGGFIILSCQEYRNALSVKQKGTYRILCIGESTTQNQYPPFLEQALNQRNIGLRFSVIDKGRTGLTTSAILTEIESWLDEYHPDMVIAMVGINDRGGHIPYEEPATSLIIRSVRGMRIYKCIRFLWFYAVRKSEELRQRSLLRSGRQAEEQLSGVLNVNEGEGIGRKRAQALYHNEEALKGLLEVNPHDTEALFYLAKLYKDTKRYAEAEERFKELLKLDPLNERTNFYLGWLYLDWGNNQEAENCFKKISTTSLCVSLAWLYLRSGRCQEAEESLKRFLERDPTEPVVNGALAALYVEKKDFFSAEKYFLKAHQIRSKRYNPDTVNNYLAMKGILDKRKIRLVCVQYPLLPLKELKRVFRDDCEGVIFVDNEITFKEAVAQYGYKAYFKDMFAGEFGHCTERGNRLLAENIAEAILKEAFHK